MRVRFELPYGEVAIPVSTSSYTFVPSGEYRPIPTGAQWARAQTTMAIKIGSGTVEVRPAIEFNTSEDGTPTQATTLGTAMTSNNLYHPTGAIDISSNASQYLVWRPGWLLKNTDASVIAHAWVGGYIEVWGDP